MTAYPCKSPKNGSRDHVMLPAASDPTQAIDAWPGDTASFPNGNVWRLGLDGQTWTLIRTAASTPLAA